MDDMDTIERTEALEARARRLCQEFEAQAARHDADDSFVAGNFARLKEEGLLAAGVPAELGGGGAGIGELAGMLRILGAGCGSTALALAMHTHSVATPAWRWKNQPQAKAAVEPLLKMVAEKGAVLVTSGGSDWIGGSGKAEKVEGGYRVTARKAFASSSPVGNVLSTMVLAGNKVIHFAVPLSAPEVTKLDNWRTLGMRGTGSHDLQIENFFVPDDKVALIREAGAWHPLWHIIVTMAFPLIYAVYVGVAEGARDLSLEMAKPRGDAGTRRLAGEMETALWGARVAHDEMVRVAEAQMPSAVTVNRIMMGRRSVEEKAIRAVELAMELAGGAGFYRERGLERRFRDIQAARYHPMKREAQYAYAGALALGEPVDAIY
jgi:alkylation response protein AidB-like acyl-CoA dehydrogenase